MIRKQNDPFKKFKEQQKLKQRNPQKVHMMAVEKYLHSLEDLAKEEKNSLIQKRPLNEEVINKEFSKGISAKFQITKCDLCIMEKPHSIFECINHQQLIKLKGKHDAAYEIKDVLRGQIRSKSERERVEKSERKVSLLSLNN